MHIQYGQHNIKFKVERGNRKSMAISVRPNKQVVVRAPMGSQCDAIKKVVRKKAAWILKQQLYFIRFHPFPPVRRYQNGETHYYLGRQYRIKRMKSNVPQVRMKGRYFYISYPGKNSKAKTKTLLSVWYTERARQVVVDRSMYYWPLVHSGVQALPPIQVRKMTKSWGSCSKGKRITFNLELIKAPKYCLDYVVVHELCHLVHPRHDQGFYRLIKQIMPDWERRKEKLEKVVI